MKKQPVYSAEVKERAVRLVRECEHEHPSHWVAITSVAGKIGCTPETLRKWVKATDKRELHPQTHANEQRLKELEREVRELRQANEILRKASAFFAQAELVRRPGK